MEFQGTIRCLSTNGSYEIIFIDEYKSIVIDSLNAATSSIRDAVSGEIYNLDIEKNRVLFMKNNEPTSFFKLLKDEVAIIYTSKNKTGEKLIRLYVGGTEQEGIVTQIEEDNIWINETAYKQSPSFVKDIYVGLEAKFYFNLNQEIVNYQLKESTRMVVGYLLAVDAEGSQFNQRLMIKMLNHEGKVQVYSCVAKPVVDGISIEDVAHALNGKGSAWGGLKALEMKVPIRYMLNDNGEILKIDTILSGEGGPYDTLLKLTDMNQRYYYVEATQILTQNGRGAFRMKPTSTMISVYSEGNDDTRYAISSISGSIPGGKWPTGDVYSTLGEDYVGDIFVWTDISSTLDWNQAFMFEEMNHYLSDSGDESYKIIGNAGGNKVTYILTDDSISTNGALKNIFVNIQKGDFLRVKVDRNKQISSAELLFLRDGSAKRNTANASVYAGKYYFGDSEQETRLIYGKIIDNRDGYLVIRYGNDESNLCEIVNATGSAVSQVELINSAYKISTGLKPANLSMDDTVLIYISTRRVGHIVIYNDATL